MTENDLADDLESGAFNDANYNKKKAADFVRQQQAEIEALKAKTLTDEEIVELHRQFRLFDSVYTTIKLARAILRKANEK